MHLTNQHRPFPKAATLIRNAAVFYWRVRRFLREEHFAGTPAFKALRNRYYRELWRDVADALELPLTDIGCGYLRLGRESHHTFVREAKVMLDDHLSLQIAGNKPLVHRLLTERGYAVQDYLDYRISDLSEAQRFLRESDSTCVVKPAIGGGAGHGITTKIRTAKHLRRASRWAATFGPHLLIEREVPGDSYRLLYIGGHLIDAVRRDPPAVTGDGSSSIGELMQRETSARLQSTEIAALSPLVPDLEARYHLAATGRMLRSVPDKGERVVVKTVCNQNCRNENHSVTASVHPATVADGARIARLFNLELVGVDLITPDIAKPLAEVGGVINEINTTPGIHHHYLVANPQATTHVACRIIEYILNKQPRREPV